MQDSATDANTISNSRPALLEEKEISSKSVKFSPTDFESFVPWVCALSNVHNVLITRIEPERSIHDSIRDEDKENEPNDINTEKVTEPKTIKKSVIDINRENISLHCTKELQQRHAPPIKIQAHYDINDFLEQISIIKSPIPIPVIVFQAIDQCIDYHPNLNRLNIRSDELCGAGLYQISQFLPRSDITTICLDDSYVPHGNFYVLLRNLSRLSYLYLNRCRINDIVCQKIAECLVYGTPASNTLQVLEMASNNITDIGMTYLTTMLRSNRRLLHLNLADNKFKDKSVIALLTSLSEFLLIEEEFLEMKRRRLIILRNERSGETTEKKKNTELSLQPSLKTSSSKYSMNKRGPSTSKRKVTIIHSPFIEDEDLNRANYIKIKLGHLSSCYPNDSDDLYPFSSNNVYKGTDGYYCKGNFALCSLNLAYNKLNEAVLKKIDDVVSYQSHIDKSLDGLMRIVIDGNNFPKTCKEIDHITKILNATIDGKRSTRKANSTVSLRSSQSDGKGVTGKGPRTPSSSKRSLNWSPSRVSSLVGSYISPAVRENLFNKKSSLTILGTSDP